MKMISYWESMEGKDKEIEPFFDNGELFFICGYYNHKGVGKRERRIGLHWNGNFPYVKTDSGVPVLSPFVISKDESLSIVRGLRNDIECGVYGQDGKENRLKKINAVLKFLSDE